MTPQRSHAPSSKLLLLSVATTLLLTVTAFTSQSTCKPHDTTTALNSIFDKFRKSDAEVKLIDQLAQPATYELNDIKVKGDNYDARLVRPVLKQTRLESRPLEVAYNAQWDGWSPEEFHKKVDNKGPAVVLAKTSHGLWVGAYNPRGWTSKNKERSSIAAFLFYQKKDIGDWQKLRALNGGWLSVSKDSRDSGIYLGNESLVIPLKRNDDVEGKATGNIALNGKQAYSKLNTYYEDGPDELKSLFGKENSENLVELKVLVGVYEKDEKIPNSD